MGKFTISDNPVVDKTIQKQLDEFVSFALEQLERKSIYSIVLGGSFGKGEGPVRITGDEIVTLRDFDIYIFTCQEKTDENTMIEYIRKKCMANHHTSPIFIDLHFCSIKDLNRLDTMNKYIPRLLHYDLRYNSILLYGNDIRNILPSYEEETIPKFEGLRFLINKLIHSVELLPMAETLLAKKIKDDLKENFLIDIAEIYIRCAKSLLLLFDQYEPSTQIASQKFMRLLNPRSHKNPLLKELLEIFPGIEKDILTYMKLKMNPTNHKEHLTGSNFDEWMRALQFLLKVIEIYKNSLAIDDANHCRWFIYTQTPSYLWHIFRHKYKIKLPKVILNIVSTLAHIVSSGIWVHRIYREHGILLPRLFKNICDPRLRLYSSILSAFEAVDKNGGIDQLKLKKAYLLLKEVYPVRNDFDNDNVSVKLTSYFELFLKAAYFYFTGLLAKKTLIEFYSLRRKRQ